MSLIFYHAPNSTAVATHWVLEELGMPYDKVRLELPKRDQDKADFRALNPNGKVPVVVHDGTPIFESAAIAAYLGETFGVAKRLYPEAGAKRALALQWLVWTNVSLAHSIAVYTETQGERVPAAQQNAAVAAAAKAEAERLLGILDTHLANRTWMLGDHFSIVDAHVAAFVGYAGMVGFPAKPWKHVDAWLARAAQRPGFAASMQS
jgi:glutathione S-transferase